MHSIFMNIASSKTAVLQAIEAQFHDLIRARVEEFGASLPTALPLLRDAALPSEKPTYLAISGMYGGFSYWLEGSLKAPRLIVASWSRVVGYSGERHEITAEATRLIDSGFV